MIDPIPDPKDYPSFLITYLIKYPTGPKQFVDKFEAPDIGYAVANYFSEGLTGFPTDLDIDSFEIIKVEKV